MAVHRRAEIIIGFRISAVYAITITIVSALLFSIFVGETLAASITVDKASDEDSNGACTLRDAITAANTDTATNGCTAGSGADTITLAVNITLVQALPFITSEITIEGADYDIDGNDQHNIFWIKGGNLTVNDITLTGGRAGNYGGAINAEDGSVLTVTNSRLEDNHAGLLGGAIATSNSNVVISSSVFVGNSSGSLGGALSFFSNGPGDVGWKETDVVATLLIDRTAFGEDVPSGCAAADISADPENWASASGGALDLAGGDVTIRRSSFIGNKAGTDGGAIYASPWQFLFENNTVSCNRADADGGGIYVIVGDLTLRHNTIYQNSAGDEGGGLYSVDDSEGYPDTATVTWGLYLQNSIIAGCTGGGDCVARDEIDHNIGMYIADGSCDPACDGQDGPINLGDLQGEPAYHPLLDGSIAINRADVDVCSLPEATETPSNQAIRSQQAQDAEEASICEELEPGQDQIGTNRPMYGDCDIGSIESRTGVELETIADTDPSPTSTSTPSPTIAPDLAGTDAAATQTAQKETEDAADRDAVETAVKQTQDAAATNAAATQTAQKGTEDAADNDAERTAVKQTQDAAATDAAATQTAQKETEDAGAIETADAHATETEIAKLPPADQTATAEAANGTATAEAELTLTASPTLDGSITPSPTASPDPATRCTLTVEIGDTLFQLAQTYNTTVEKFRAINQLTEDALFVGSELIVPDCYRPGDDLENSALGFSCQNLYDSMVVRTSSQVVGCRDVDLGLIDKHPALASGMIAAIDIIGYVESGVEVCFRNIGELVFLDRATEPPTPKPLQSYNNAVGMTCGEVDQLGTLVLVAALIERDTFVELSNCQVTTTQTVRLRDDVGSATALGLVPYNVTLDTYSRTNNWFNVTFLGTEGWISARYARADGICE